MDCNPPGSSVHGILQTRILEWVAMPFSRDIPDPGYNHCSALPANSLPSEPPRKPFTKCVYMAISISQFISLPFSLLDVHTYIHSVLAFLLTYGFNKNWMAQLHSAEWLNWTEMLSFLLASQPATILNQNSAAVYFELFQFPSTCYCKGAKICISPNWRPWWSVLLSSTQSGWKCIHRGREKKKVATF